MKNTQKLLLIYFFLIGMAWCCYSQNICPVISPPPVPACPDVKNIDQKIKLWNSGGTCLRGANIWQKRVIADDGMGEGPVGPPYKESDIQKLADWGANYVNISHPGIFAERPGDRGRYYEQEGVFANLENLIKLCRKYGLFVVVSFRTGPERSEYVFDTTERPKYTGVWESPDARRAWADMWAVTASRLKRYGNVIGYDLMVEPGLEPEGDHPRKWKEMAENIREAIADPRKGNDRTTPVLIGLPGGSGIDAVDSKLADADARTVYVIHQYKPDEYAQPENWQNPITFPGGLQNMLPFLEGIYGRIDSFRRTRRNAPVAVNEFGAVRNAFRAECYVGLQFELLERRGINHSLWLWETSFPLGYDEFNFRFGPDPSNKREVENSALITTIKTNWARNKKDLISLMDKFDKK